MEEQYELKPLMKNIYQKKEAAFALRQSYPSEASYLAGYCVECFIKCAIALGGVEKDAKDPQVPYPKVHIGEAKLNAAWERTRFQVCEYGYTQVQNYFSKYQRSAVFTQWSPHHRYDPDWSFGAAMEEVFDQSIPDLLHAADRLRLDYLGRFCS